MEIKMTHIRSQTQHANLSTTRFIFWDVRRRLLCMLSATALCLVPSVGLPQKIEIDLSPFLFDAVRAGDAGKVSALLAQGADVNSRNDTRSTPLMVAAALGHVEVVRLLLKRDADVNAANQDGITALAYAEVYGHEGVVALLKQHGAK